ncbi:hypothetical protein A6P39_009195 [Streptomyces sp. FXJ1.172]|uniref:hypothetical protein n=1 Tax=Streptomyces sp. FXJ1.172 TaxID=710705 RepID=UPI0013317EBE|nr:hypothetical protein [Streptomyces sp. FXJ1.172]WEO94175.1 hypothetical protein A6P39_009195 [Streptomyces sp. FXJ1.172]
MRDTTAAEAPAGRAVITSGAGAVLLVDGAELPGAGRARVCGPGDPDPDAVVSGGPADPAARPVLREAGAEEVVAQDQERVQR